MHQNNMILIGLVKIKNKPTSQKSMKKWEYGETRNYYVNIFVMQLNTKNLKVMGDTR